MTKYDVVIPSEEIMIVVVLQKVLSSTNQSLFEMMRKGKGVKDAHVSFAQNSFYWNSTIHSDELQIFCNTTEKFKLLLADLGDAFFSYVEDKTSAVEKWRERWHKEGRDEEWIEARLKSDITRNEWTNELQVRGITVAAHFAYLTNKLHTLTFEVSIRDHKAVKNLSAKANLQDNSTPLELLIEATSQAAATEIHRDRNSYGLPQLDQDVADAAEVGKAARMAAERVLGRPVVSSENYLKPKKARNQVVDATTSQVPQIEAPKQEGVYRQSSLFDEL